MSSLLRPQDIGDGALRERLDTMVLQGLKDPYRVAVRASQVNQERV